MNRLEVARISRPHGVRGVVRVEPHWAGSDALEAHERVELVLESGERREFLIENATRTGKSYLVKFRDVNDREGADTLRGARLFVDREELAPNEMYLVDLVGAEVVGPDGFVGRVISVEVNPSLDTIVIERPDGTRINQALLPVYVARLDAQARRIELSSLDGLFE
ncbi:MAG TPA: ribosome maturation factor RimM [Polyangiaceae bacterium]|nr:ribosome maturation factor RimM [Polyangiaceae bacterium]